MKKQFIMLVGLPGSGKSTYLEQSQPPGNFVTLSTDAFIEEEAKRQGKTYADVFDSYIKTAHEKLETALSQAIKEGKSIIWDQTNTNAWSRASKLALIPADYERAAIVFQPPLKEILKRAEERGQKTGKIIPERVLRQFYEKFQYPEKSEGFSQVLNATKGDLPPWKARQPFSAQAAEKLTSR